ncbi:hypothetical protein PP707_04525 [Acetobacter pasteurianus]|nr:hypothetical protein [Acetobacter pasteurianus]
MSNLPRTTNNYYCYYYYHNKIIAFKLERVQAPGYQILYEGFYMSLITQQN